MDQVLNRLSALYVADVMNKHVVCLQESQTLEQAGELFAKHHISSAPVMNEEGRCVGILSVTDFLRSTRDGGPNVGRKISDCMSTGVQSIAPSVSLLRAAIIMSTEHVHHLPVIDAPDRLVGVISTMDVVSALINAVEEADGPILGRK